LRLNPHTGRGRATEPPGGDAGKGQLIQVATRCGTIDEFVEKFASYAWEGSLVLPAATALPVGTQGRFVILLRDQTIAMRGRCRVTEAKQAPVSSRNPAVKRIMMRVALLEMDEQSRAVHKRLIALRSAPVPLPVPTEPSETTQIEPAKQGTAPGAAAAPSVPAPPVRTPPPAPPVNRTIIGVGLGPDGRAFLSKPAPVGAPPAPQRPQSDLDVTSTGSDITKSQDVTATGSPDVTATGSYDAPRSRVATLPHGEVRAPGSPYTLPANPLSEFDAQDVDEFIECKLLEADEEMGTGIADQPPPQAGTGDEHQGGHARRETPAARAGSFAAKLPSALQGRMLRWAPYAAVLAAGIILGIALRGKRQPVVAGAPAPTAAPMQARVPQPEIKPVQGKVEAPAPAAAAPQRVEPPPAAKAAKPKEAAAASADLEAPVADKSAAAEKPAAVEKPAGAEKPAAAAKPAATAKPPAPEKVAAAEAPAAPEKAEAVEAPAAQAKLAMAEKPAPAERAAAAPAAAPEIIPGESGACMARVITEPKDAKVIWGGTVIGRSPIESAKVPCGAAKVTVERERWQPVSVDVTLQDGDTGVVRQRLHRPRGVLVISSSPPGAQITVNHVAAGAAPRQVDIQRYEKVPIKVTLKGYQPFSKTIYLKDSEAKIDAQLVPRK
jgi:hypothetical protein